MNITVKDKAHNFELTINQGASRVSSRDVVGSDEVQRNGGIHLLATASTWELSWKGSSPSKAIGRIVQRPYSFISRSCGQNKNWKESEKSATNAVGVYFHAFVTLLNGDTLQIFGLL